MPGAVEYMNCGKSVFSRVARVCKNDLGGTRSLNAKWTSFLKARLNCSVPGNYPFYFDEIQDISQLIKVQSAGHLIASPESLCVLQGSYGDQVDSVVYAVFRTAPNSISGSAVCAFRLRDFAAAFEGQFKEQKSTGDNWLAVEHHKVPSPRPGNKLCLHRAVSSVLLQKFLHYRDFKLNYMQQNFALVPAARKQNSSDLPSPHFNLNFGHLIL